MIFDYEWSLLAAGRCQSSNHPQFRVWVSLVDPFSSVSNSNSKNNSRKDAKVQRNDYHVSVFLRAFAPSREKYFYLFGRYWPLIRGRYTELIERFRPFPPVRNNKNNPRRDTKTQRKDYYVCVFLRAFAPSREKYFYLFGRCWPVSDDWIALVLLAAYYIHRIEPAAS